MEKMTYRILKPFAEYAVGDLVDFTDEEAKGLLIADVVKKVVEPAEVRELRLATTAQIKLVSERAAEAGARRALADAAHSVRGIRIETGTTQEDKLARRGGFKNFGHFIYDIFKAGRHGENTSEELKAWSKVAGEMGEYDNAQGGFLVPMEFMEELLKNALEASIVRSRARVIPMKTNSIGIPAINDTSHANNVYGGVVIYRTGEGAAKTKSKPALRKVNLTLSKLTGLVYVSDELMEDSPISVSVLINSIFPEAISFYADDDYINGNGANQPLGMINAANPSLIAVSKVAGQAADSVVFENIIDMWSRLFPRCQGKAVWLANNDVFPQLAAMNMSVGAGGVPVWMPAGGVSGAPYSTLMGRPLIFTEKCQTVGDQGDIALVDPSQYLIGQKAGGAIKAATSIHLRFDYDQTAFRFVLRHDGQPWWNAPLRPKNSTATLSPFVVLEDRA